MILLLTILIYITNYNNQGIKEKIMMQIKLCKNPACSKPIPNPGPGIYFCKLNCKDKYIHDKGKITAKIITQFYEEDFGVKAVFHEKYKNEEFYQEIAPTFDDLYEEAKAKKPGLKKKDFRDIIEKEKKTILGSITYKDI